MTDFVSPELIERAGDVEPVGESRRQKARAAPSDGLRATVVLAPEDFRAELACGCPQAGVEREPYEQGFGAYASGAGLPDNPYTRDNCAHQQWANGWSQARDEAQRRAHQAR